MAVITSGSHPQSQWPGIHSIFGKTYRDQPLIFAMLFDQRQSNKSYELVVEDTGFGLPVVKAQGASVSYDTDAEGYTSRFTNTVYGLGAIVTKEAITDNQYEEVASRKAAKLARSMRHGKETVHANVLNNGFSSSYLGGDGVELLSTAHVTMDGTQSNELAVAADFSEAALEDLLVQIRNAKDSVGLHIGLSGQKLVVPPALSFDATRVLSSTNQSGTANNDINAVRAQGLLPGGVVTWPFLTDSDAWFVTTDAPDGLITMNRWKLAFTQDNDFDTDNARMKAVERYAAGWGDWRGVYGSPGV